MNNIMKLRLGKTSFYIRADGDFEQKLSVAQVILQSLSGVREDDVLSIRSISGVIVALLLGKDAVSRIFDGESPRSDQLVDVINTVLKEYRRTVFGE